MAAIKVKSKTVSNRDGFGRFAAACDKAARDTVKETVERGARTSRALAPGSGYNVASYSRKPGYVPLKRSIKVKVNGMSGYWYSIAPHAMHIEFGTSAHIIYGKLHFNWKGGVFVWNNPEFPGNQDEGGAYVFHPGNSAQPFMRPAYDRVVKRQMMEIAKEKYPG